MPTTTSAGKTQMSSKWYSMTCDCGFEAKSHNQGEMEEIGMVHVKRSHPDMKVGPNDIRNKIRST